MEVKFTCHSFSMLRFILLTEYYNQSVSDDFVEEFTADMNHGAYNKQDKFCSRASFNLNESFSIFTKLSLLVMLVSSLL